LEIFPFLVAMVLITPEVWVSQLKREILVVMWIWDAPKVLDFGLEV
jgi:hypothetical protein